MLKRRFLTAVIAATACIGAGLAQQPADTILYNGKVLTVDKGFTIAQAVAVRGTQIAAVGSDADIMKLAGPNTMKLDLKGKTVTPGLINTHLHIESPGGYAKDLPATKLKQYALNFRAVNTKDDVIKQMKDTIAAFKFKPGEWVYFTANPRGDQAKLLFDILNRWELDKAAPDNPVALTLGLPVVNGLMVNSKGIEALWKKHGDFIETYGRYWIDASGKPSGILEPPAVRILLEDPDFIPPAAPEDVGPFYRKILEEHAALGLTTISGSLHTSIVNVYRWLEQRGEMPVRYGYGEMSTFGIPGADNTKFKMGAGTDTIWITSLSARAVDGSGSRMCISLKRDSTAAAAVSGDNAAIGSGLSAASEWWPRGQCSLDIEYNGAKGARIKKNYFMEWYNEVAKAGLRSGNAHVSGNDSHSMLLTEYEKIDRAKPGAVKGWAMDHCNLIDPRDIPRAAKLGLMWSCGSGNAIDEEVVAAFGEQITHSFAAPIKKMVDAGINVSLEGEGAGTFWGSVELLVTRKDEHGKVWGPNERVDRATALRIATQNGANYVLKGDKLGSLEPGKFADLVILDRDYMTMSEDDIGDMRPLMTMMGGKVMFLRTDFSAETNMKPQGATISTYEELQKRRPAGGMGGGG
jgi:predicted amidohydrolase YtcJ